MKIIVFILFNIVFVSSHSYENINTKNDTKILSRKRRFLQFPTGSSFQLVYCLTYTSIVNSYFVFGNTAALAWELPSMPLFFDGRDFQKKEETTTEATTTEITSKLDHGYNNNLDRVSSYGNLNYIQDSYRNPFYKYMVKPDWFDRYRKSSYLLSKSTPQIGENQYYHFKRYSENNSHMMFKINPEFHQIYRRTRRELYNKLEGFLTRINLDGKACLLKAVCEVTKYGTGKDTLLIEIFKAIFRVKPHKEHNMDEYDLSANESHNCEEMYPSCQGSIRNINLLVRK
ncbi:uncharacterized protein LOC126734216 [Anthonomus grandis grandis]|uniref:uncharacterized protein LOC126734216 n=1 Tax=Anthonomus grandis grandis TaxID=2921223 RepID=UPI00216645B2|nr:uncharacterized protein LOC126734216 [Anthonomus grandis grandis]